ncbi:DUF2381 family protein [Hyalangium rubrum]|uniref:DUF2381 family protein n=1 Tax=Hyalangium rubrum TaxID=3103134 RepID=A0ABU5H8X0_9BACT|nr:DUF2381 family protein [Hyalangium sp. s54d21]MDY7229755.1 DUF2381 family protein [Hyalangium sp. s54d21]
MVQPTTLVLALVLILGTTARAQPRAPREQRQRHVSVTGNPADPPHEIHVAKGVATLLRFKSQINRDAVDVEGHGTRITLDAGDSSIILEPLVDLGSAERLALSVLFADGQRAVFVLVSHVSEVDTRIDVIRREQTVESCLADLAESQARCSKLSPMNFARAGLLTPIGVITRALTNCIGAPHTASGLVCENGTAHRAERWALVDLQIRNAPDQTPWVPSEVTIKSMQSGVPLTVRAVEMDAAHIASGEVGRLFVEIAPPDAGEPFVMELRDATGRGISIPEVRFRAKESTQ